MAKPRREPKRRKPAKRTPPGRIKSEAQNVRDYARTYRFLQRLHGSAGARQIMDWRTNHQAFALFFTDSHRHPAYKVEIVDRRQKPAVTYACGVKTNMRFIEVIREERGAKGPPSHQVVEQIEEASRQLAGQKLPMRLVIQIPLSDRGLDTLSQQMDRAVLLANRLAQVDVHFLHPTKKPNNG